MADTKRRVVSSAKDAPADPKKKRLSRYSDQVARSTSETLNDADLGSSYDLGSGVDQYGEQPQDQYAQVLQAKDESGQQRRVVLPSKQDQQAPQTWLKPSFQIQDNRPQDHQEKRAQDIAKILNSYNAATKDQAFRSRNTGTRAASIALSNPAAAAQLAAGRKNYQNQPVQTITGGLRAGQDAVNMEKGVSNLADQDEQRDPDSRVSDLYRQQLTNRGIKFTGKPSAADIKKVYPMIGAGIKQDTAMYNTNTVATTAYENRLSKEQVAAKQRANAKAIAEGHDKAGVGRVIIGGALAQDRATAKGTGAAQQRTANLATIPHSFKSDKYLVTKKGIPPDQHRAQAVTDAGGQGRKYADALQQAIRLVKQANGRPYILDQNWPKIKSAMAYATQRNIKAMGNGVANGPDIIQAEKAIGTVDDLQTFLRNGLLQKMEQSANSIPRAYQVFADSQGYELSEKPSQTTTNLGTGGSQSSRRPVNQATGASANEIAGQYGFGPVTGKQPTPETPPIPPKSDFIPGQQYDTTNGPAIFVGINPQTGKRQWKAVSK